MNAKVQLMLWMAHPVMELSLAAIMVWRKLHRTFPVFFAYILCEILQFSILFPIHQYGSDLVYYYGYWIGAAISLAVGFMVIYEIFQDVFRPYHTLKDLGTVLFKWAALVMMFVAIVVAAASTGDQSPLGQAVITVQRCVRLIQCGLILFLLVFSRYLGVSWRQHSFGIVLGFGGYASVELAGNALYAGRLINSPVSGYLYTSAYALTILTWLGYALLKSPAREASLSLMASHRWEESLTDLQHPAGGDSLIPMFEGMVDRAFSRSATARGSEPAPIVSKPSIRKAPASAKLEPTFSGTRVRSQG